MLFSHEITNKTTEKKVLLLNRFALNDNNFVARKKIVLLTKEEENSEALNSIHLFTYALQIELKREKSRVVKQRAKNKQKVYEKKEFIDFLINIL